jgi:hypothetical protein
MRSNAPPTKPLRLWTTRVAWFIALWCAGLAAVSCLAFVIRIWLKA